MIHVANKNCCQPPPLYRLWAVGALTWLLKNNWKKALCCWKMDICKILPKYVFYLVNACGGAWFAAREADAPERHPQSRLAAFTSALSVLCWWCMSGCELKSYSRLYAYSNRVWKVLNKEMLKSMLMETSSGLPWFVYNGTSAPEPLRTESANRGYTKSVYAGL